MVKYPNELDTDADIPRIDDNITEIGGEVINDLREAVFALEETLGLTPQGSTTDLAERLDQSLDANGNIKASALSTAGIITTPITNNDVDLNAGIAEDKLDLNYATVSLKTWIDALGVLVVELQNKVAQDIANLTAHTAHPATYGRHRAADVDAFGGTYDGYDVQGTVDSLDGRIDAHISDPSGAHPASAISVDDTPLTSITATDTQSAIEQLEELQLREVVRHQDRQHSNGVIRAQDVFYGNAFKNGTPIISAGATSSGVVGNDFIRFALAPDPQGFNSIKRNDLVSITISGTEYVFRVRSIVAPLTINIYGVIPVSGAGTVSVFANEEETSAPSSLVLALRNSNLSDRASTVQLVHPDAAFILGNGFKGSDLSASKRYLRIRYFGGESGDTGDLDLQGEMTTFSSIPSTWTVENVAKILNEELFAPPSGSETHHPLIAFSYLGELGIAYDRTGSDGYIQIENPAGDSAAETLGLTEGDIAYGLSPRSSYIDGYQFSGMTKLVDAYGIITSSDTITVPNASLVALGVKDGMVVRVSEFEEGSYVIKTVGTDTLTFDTFFEHNFSSNINKGVHVTIYADAFSLPAAPSDRTLYEMFVRYADDYGGTGKMEASVRVEYADFGGFSAANLDMMAVSRDFRTASRRVFWDVSQSTLELGLPVGSSVVFTGPSVILPPDPRGTIVRLYDGYGTDYVELQVAQTLPLVNGYMDIDIKDPISEERYIQVATILHDKVSFKLLDDRRLFGTVGRNDVRDDFTRDYTSYPRSLLRGNGVIRGMAASGTGTGQIELNGGEVIVDGKIKSVRAISIPVPADGGATYNLVIDCEGVTKLWQDDFFSSDILATPSLVEIMTGSTETVLAQVTTDGYNVITAINDLRRFVGKIDDRIDLIVEENDITYGSFASFEAAINYLAALGDDSPVPRKFQVRGQVDLASEVEMPDHVIVEGDGYSTVMGARINYTNSSARLAVYRGVVFKDLAFLRSGTLVNGFIGGKAASGNTLDNVRIEGCGFIFLSQAMNNNVIVCDRMLESRISKCRFAKIGRGVFVDGFLFGSAVERNIFDGVHQNAIYVANSDGYGATDLTIAENIISTTTFDTGSNTALVRLESPQRTVFRHNSLSCDGTAAAARSMLWVENTSRFCHFIENTFLNGSVSNQGFQKAMLFDGGGGLATSDHFFDTINGNVISGFEGGSARGMDLSACDNTEISGNFIWNCRQPFYADECQWLKVTNNRFTSIDNATLVTIQGNNTKNIVFSYNTLVANNAFMNQRLMYVQSSATGPGGYIIGNDIWFQPLVGTNTMAQLYVDGPEWYIAYNTIGSLSALGFHTGEAPVTLSSNANQSILVYNNFRHAIVFGPAFRAINNSTTLDQFNKGITYEVVIPTTRCFTETGTAWEFFMVATPYKAEFRNASGTDEQAGLEFSNLDVPTRARLVSVQINAQVQAANDLTVTWRKALYTGGGSSGSLVVASVNPSTTGTYATFTLTAGGSEFMTNDEIHLLEFKTDSSLAGTVWIAGVRVIYEF